MSEIDYQESSGNVFADLGLADAEALYTRATLGYAVRKILKERGLKQREIAALLTIKQPEVSNLVNGKYHLFSEGRLIGFLNRLDRTVTIKITPHRQGEPFQQIAFGM